MASTALTLVSTPISIRTGFRLYFERNKRLGKRALEALREERSKKGIKGRVPIKQKVVTESDWKDYYGSHPKIKELLKDQVGHYQGADKQGCQDEVDALGSYLSCPVDR